MERLCARVLNKAVGLYSLCYVGDIAAVKDSRTGTLNPVGTPFMIEVSKPRNKGESILLADQNRIMLQYNTGISGISG